MVSRTISHEEVPFRFISNAHEGRLALSLHGELDLACSDLLSPAGIGDDAELREVVLDLADLEFIDTAGVRALVDVRARNEERGRTFAMDNPTSLVRRVITLFGREDMLATR